MSLGTGPRCIWARAGAYQWGGGGGHPLSPARPLTPGTRAPQSHVGHAAIGRMHSSPPPPPPGLSFERGGGGGSVVKGAEGTNQIVWPKLTCAEGARNFLDWPKARRKVCPIT